MASFLTGYSVWRLLKGVIPHLGEIFFFKEKSEGILVASTTSLHFPEKSMADDHTISQLLGTLYAAPMMPDLWPSFMEQTVALLGIEKAALFTHDLARNEHRVLSHIFGENSVEGVRQYEEFYWQYDEWSLRGLPRLAAGRVGFGDEVWPVEEMQRGPFFNEFLKRQNICQLACIVNVSGPRVYDNVSFYLGSDQECFSAAQIALLDILVPHLRSALTTRRRLAELQARAGSLEDALDKLSSALVMLDVSGRAVFVNAAALSILSSGYGVSLANSRLSAAQHTETKKLQCLIEMAIATGTGKALYGGGTMSIPREGKAPLHLLVSPLCSEDRAIPGSAVAIVFLTDPEQGSSVPAEVLRTLFGLTQAEAKIALAILNGHTLSETADLNRVSRETVKSQMNAIFSKTRTRRQGELIRLLSKLPSQSK